MISIPTICSADEEDNYDIALAKSPVKCGTMWVILMSKYCVPELVHPCPKYQPGITHWCRNTRDEGQTGKVCSLCFIEAPDEAIAALLEARKEYGCEL